MSAILAYSIFYIITISRIWVSHVGYPIVAYFFCFGFPHLLLLLRCLLPLALDCCGSRFPTKHIVDSCLSRPVSLSPCFAGASLQCDPPPSTHSPPPRVAQVQCQKSKDKWFKRFRETISCQVLKILTRKIPFHAELKLKSKWNCIFNCTSIELQCVQQLLLSFNLWLWVRI